MITKNINESTVKETSETPFDVLSKHSHGLTIQIQ
jgi:hypothetical protein